MIECTMPSLKNIMFSFQKKGNNHGTNSDTPNTLIMTLFDFI
jgi:hypothetical protein